MFDYHFLRNIFFTKNYLEIFERLQQNALLNSETFPFPKSVICSNFHISISFSTINLLIYLVNSFYIHVNN